MVWSKEIGHSYVKTMNHEPYFMSYRKIQMIHRPKFKAKTTKLLQENIRENLHDFGSGKNVIHTTTKAWTRRAKKKKKNPIYWILSKEKFSP